MAGLVSGAPGGNSSRATQDRQDETAGCWYMSRKEIEENSPSRKDGIDLKKETSAQIILYILTGFRHET